MEEGIRERLPTPATPTLQASPKDTDRDILVRQLMEMISPPTLAAQELRPTKDVETPFSKGNSQGGVRRGGVFFMRRADPRYREMSGFR